jgi:hypothetical protein
MSGIYSYMKVHCPICKGEFDGMKCYGREARCCDRECYDEWQWRYALSVTGKPYTPRKGSRWDDSMDPAEFAAKRIAELESTKGA